MNFMDPDELPAHLDGFAGFINTYILKRADLPYALGRASHVRLTCGCVIEPGFDANGEVREFLDSIRRSLRCLLFVDSALFDYDGSELARYQAPKE